MIIVKHRINTSKQLRKININYGVEIDLRSNNESIYLSHDPFRKGELLSKWIKYFKHKMIVLHVKEEGLEGKIIKILNQNNVRNFFFHDQSFSSLLKNMNKTNVSVRYSEFEELKKMDILFTSIKWLWIDNFSEIRISKKLYKLLKKNNVKICIVSPELIKKNRSNEIKDVISYFKINQFKIDAVCTKKPKNWI